LFVRWYDVACVKIAPVRGLQSELKLDQSKTVKLYASW